MPGEHGFGLAGIRDRAALVGGSFEFGPGTEGGSRLRVVVPRADAPHPHPTGGADVTDPIRIVVADDHPIVRAGIVGLLEQAPGIEVVGEAADGAEAVELAASEHPDLVLMDLRMPGVDGASATASIVAAGHGTRVLVLTTYETDDHILAAIEAGRERLPPEGRAAGGDPRGHPGRRRGRDGAGAVDRGEARVARARRRGIRGTARALAARARGARPRGRGALEPRDRPQPSTSARPR